MRFHLGRRNVADHLVEEEMTEAGKTWYAQDRPGWKGFVGALSSTGSEGICWRQQIPSLPVEDKAPTNPFHPGRSWAYQVFPASVISSSTKWSATFLLPRWNLMSIQHVDVIYGDNQVISEFYDEKK